MSEARIQLSSALSKIGALISSIPTAEQKAASISEYYTGLKVGFDRYGNQLVPNNLTDAAKRANEIIKRELVEAVEQEFRDKAAAVSSEIESLRVILPQLAAKACVELGIVARDLAARAESLPLSTEGERTDD